MLKNKKYLYYILILISILFVIVAIALVTSNKFIYCLQNIDYYDAKYKTCNYLHLALEWKNLYNEALRRIVLHIIGAVIFALGGGIGLYFGIKQLKKIKNSNESKDLS